jgi:prophage tail gpP-like protein
MSEHDWRWFNNAASTIARAPPPPSVPNPAEVATLVVNNRVWDDWTSVKVECRCAEAFDIFTFSNVERPISVQFRQGDTCAVYLAGTLAITGVITTRQVAYDANNVGIQLIGKSVTFFAARGSILDETGDLDGMTFEQVAKKLIAPFGVGVDVVGKLDDTPLENAQVQPGEKLWDCLERLARPLGIVMGSDHMGNFLLIGDHSTVAEDTLIEGYNIKSLKAVVSVENVHSEYLVDGQKKPKDDSEAALSTQERGRAAGSSPRYSPLLTPAETPVGDAEVQKRARNESIWHEGDALQAIVGVYGWKRPSGGIWRTRQSVHVQSPKAILNETLMVQSAIFSQDGGGGTMTTLELVPPFLLRGQAEANVGLPGVLQDPSTYENNKPAAPMTSVPEAPPLYLPSPL